LPVSPFAGEPVEFRLRWDRAGKKVIGPSYSVLPDLEDRFARGSDLRALRLKAGNWGNYIARLNIGSWIMICPTG
jgi:hypothetical protein